ncbi:hypothetical protein SLE2022_096140 [Rubroshorea leprosula]
MFTSQRKPWLPLTPQNGARRAGFSNPRGSLGGKGKAVMFTDNQPVLPRQHVNSLNGENVDGWKQLRRRVIARSCSGEEGL